MDGRQNGYAQPSGNYAFGNNRPQAQRSQRDVIYNPNEIRRNENKSEYNDLLLEELARLSAQLHQQEREEAQQARASTSQSQVRPQLRHQSQSDLRMSEDSSSPPPCSSSNDLNAEFQAQQAANEASTEPEVRGPGLPFMFLRDQSSSPLGTYNVGIFDVLGFNVGGEARLVFGHLRACIFPGFHDYYQYLNELEICLMDATPYQMDQLYQHNAFPRDAGNAMLIRHSSAHNLLGHMWISGVRPLNGMGDLDLRMPEDLQRQLEGEKMTLHCMMFGYHKGLYYPSLLGQHCIVCEDCGCFMMPNQFSIHCHHSVDAAREKKLRYWGFQQDRWHTHLFLPFKLEYSDEYLKQYEILREKGPLIYKRELVYERRNVPLSYDAVMQAFDIAHQVLYAQEPHPSPAPEALQSVQPLPPISTSTAFPNAISLEAQISALFTGNQLSQQEVSQLQALIQCLTGPPVVAQQPVVPQPMEQSVQQNYLQQLIAANSHPTHRTNPISDPDQPGPSGFRMAPRTSKEEEPDRPGTSKQ